MLRITACQIISLIGAVLFTAACHPSSEEHLTIAFTGDVLLDRGVRHEIEKKGAEHLFASVAPLFRKADATVVNLECPVTAVQSPINKRYIFRAEPAWLEALKKSGITHAALANNHTMDQGRSGLIDTYHHLLTAGITPVGYGKNQQESLRPILIEKGSIKVALFNSVTLPLENWVCLEDRPGICQQPIDKLGEAIKAFKKQHPDSYAVAILHWGIEYQSVPSISQRRGARLLLRSGADAIIGHHPHVIQQEEYIDGKPVFYSLGNFVFDQRKPETSKGEIVTLDFTARKCKANIHPVTIRACKPE